MHRNGIKPAISGGRVSASERLSKNSNKVANSAKVSFVSLPIIHFKGIHELRDWAFIVVGLSSNCFFVRGHRAPLPVILMPPAIIERFFESDAQSIDEATDKDRNFPTFSK
jgi:hypothetical protein